MYKVFNENYNEMLYAKWEEFDEINQKFRKAEQGTTEWWELKVALEVVKTESKYLQKLSEAQCRYDNIAEGLTMWLNKL